MNDKYIKLYAVVETIMPRNKITCTNCTFYSRSSGRCWLNQSIPFSPNTHTGEQCPLVEKEME